MTYYKVGRIVNTYGIKGQIKVIADTDFPEKRFAPGADLTIIRENQAVVQVKVKDARQAKGTYILSLQGYTNINQVEAYKGDWLAISEDQQEDLDQDEFYHHQIIGLPVVTADGQDIGKIKEILQLGSNDVWVVQAKGHKKRDILLPYIDDVVKKVDLDRGQVLVELIEGLVDDEN